MTHLGLSTAATDRVPRILVGLTGTAALAAFAWPIGVAPLPERQAATIAPPEQAALRRPLFDPGRRAWTAMGSRAAVLEVDPPRPILTLRGIRRDAGATHALIDDGSGERTWLRAGEGRDGWHVTEIGSNQVTVLQDSATFTTELMGPPAILRPVRRTASEAGLSLRP